MKEWKLTFIRKRHRQRFDAIESDRMKSLDAGQTTSVSDRMHGCAIVQDETPDEAESSEPLDESGCYAVLPTTVWHQGTNIVCRQHNQSSEGTTNSGATGVMAA